VPERLQRVLPPFRWQAPYPAAAVGTTWRLEGRRVEKAPTEDDILEKGTTGEARLYSDKL
jgi:hypothetical protein